MGIQAFVPSGGGGTPGFDYIASINMTTYNRSWAQSGAAGNYILTSNNNNSGYVYFVGSGQTTGTPIGKIVVIAHAFTRIDIVAPTGDFMSLYKAAVKSTTVFADPFVSFSSFPSTITSSGNFVLPTSALPLVNAVVVGGGGGGGGDHRGGGGGGAGVVTLTGYQAVGTTAITIGGGGGHSGHSNGSQGGTTFFGNVFAVGGGGGAGNTGQAVSAVNTGGGNAHNGHTASIAANASLLTPGLGTQSGTSLGFGGNRGAASSSPFGGGGGGATAGGNGKDGGAGHTSSITGSSYQYASGGGGGAHSPDSGHGSNPGGYGAGSHGAHGSNCCNAGGGVQGIVVVRYYIT
jgi:hypothetical protein